MHTHLDWQYRLPLSDRQIPCSRSNPDGKPEKPLNFILDFFGTSALFQSSRQQYKQLAASTAARRETVSRVASSIFPKTSPSVKDERKN